MSGRAERIFITVGTHEDPFDRLVEAGVELARAGYAVRVQVGTSRVPTPGCEATDTLPPAKMREALTWAHVVICHGGPSTLLEASRHDHVPILVPRRACHGEHVDDHQLWFARRISDRVHVVEDPRRLVEEVAAHEWLCADLRPFGPDAARTRQFAADLEVLCEDLVSGAVPRRRVRGRLLALKRWMRRPR